jgi:hypothetical protein
MFHGSRRLSGVPEWHATGWSRSLEVTAGGTGVVSPALRRLKGYGFPPAGAWCRNTRECLGMKLRPGNAGSNTFARPGGSAGGRPAAGPVPVPEQGPGPGRRAPTGDPEALAKAAYLGMWQAYVVAARTADYQAPGRTCAADRHAVQLL